MKQRRPGWKTLPSCLSSGKGAMPPKKKPKRRTNKPLPYSMMQNSKPPSMNRRMNFRPCCKSIQVPAVPKARTGPKCSPGCTACTGKNRAGKSPKWTGNGAMAPGSKPAPCSLKVLLLTDSSKPKAAFTAWFVFHHSTAMPAVIRPS